MEFNVCAMDEEIFKFSQSATERVTLGNRSDEKSIRHIWRLNKKFLLRIRTKSYFVFYFVVIPLCPGDFVANWGY